MNSLAYKKIELTNLLPTFDVQELDILFSYLENHKSLIKKRKRKSLANLWSKSNIDIEIFELELHDYKNDISNRLNKKYHDILA